MLDAFNPKHGVTLRAGNVLKKGKLETPRSVPAKITSQTLPAMREK